MSKIPTEEEFVKEYRKHSGISNAKLVYNIFKEENSFPDSYNGASVNTFLNSINSVHTHKLLKEIQENSKPQTKQFRIATIISTTALFIAFFSLFHSLGIFEHIKNLIK